MVRQVGTDVTNLAVGDKVITLVPGAYATGLILDSSACVKFPDNLSFEEAATMGCVYSTTIYSLLHLGRLRKGQVNISQNELYLLWVASANGRLVVYFGSFGLRWRWARCDSNLSDERSYGMDLEVDSIKKHIYFILDD